MTYGTKRNATEKQLQVAEVAMHMQIHVHGTWLRLTVHPTRLSAVSHLAMSTTPFGAVLWCDEAVISSNTA